MDNIESSYNKYELIIENIEGEHQISLSDIIKNSVNVFIDNNYSRILDLGCGKGRNSLFFAQHGFEVFASDICENSINILKDRICKKGITNIKVHNCNFTDILFEDSYFDAVVCTSVLHHANVKDISIGLKEIHRVLRPNGCLIFDILSIDDDSYGLGEAIEENTFVGSREGEEGIPHHYTDIKELEGLLKDFRKVNIYKSEYFINNLNGKQYNTKVFDVIVYK